MQSSPRPPASLSRSIFINFVAPLALLGGATAVFVALGTVEPPKRPDADMSRNGRLRALSPIRVEPIRLLNTTETPLFLSVDGTVVPFEEANVAAEVSGRIISKSEKCEAGGFVKQGDILMKIDPEDYQLEVQRFSQQKDQEYQRLQELDQEMLNSQKLIDVAKQDVQIQEREINRLEALPSGFASRTEIDQANRALLAATQQLVSLQNQLDIQRKQRTRIESAEKLAATQLQAAEVNLRRTEVRAPIDGVVVTEQVDVNTFVTRGSPLVTIENTSKVEVSTSLRMDQLYWILDQTDVDDADRSVGYDLPETDAIIEFEVAGRHGMTHQWNGKLLSYDGIGLDPRTRTVPVRVIVDRPSEFIHQGESTIPSHSTTPLVRGMFVRVRLMIRPKTQLYIIPTKALQPGNRIYEFTPDDSVLDLASNGETFNAKSDVIQSSPTDNPNTSDLTTEPSVENTFSPEDWTAGRVQIRNEVIPVNSLSLGNLKGKDPPALSDGEQTRSSSAASGRDFWVCEVAGLEGRGDAFVVTSPLGTVSESSFPARAATSSTLVPQKPEPSTSEPSDQASKGESRSQISAGGRS